MFTRLCADTPHRIAATLVLVFALLDLSALAARDQHDPGAPAAHGLCAVCVYSGGSNGIPESAWMAPAEPQQHQTPTGHPATVSVSPQRLGSPIRAPPASC